MKEDRRRRGTSIIVLNNDLFTIEQTFISINSFLKHFGRKGKLSGEELNNLKEGKIIRAAKQFICTQDAYINNDTLEPSEATKHRIEIMLKKAKPKYVRDQVVILNRNLEFMELSSDNLADIAEKYDITCGTLKSRLSRVFSIFNDKGNRPLYANYFFFYRKDFMELKSKIKKYRIEKGLENSIL